MTKAHIFAHRSWSGTKAEARDLLASYAAGAGGGALATLARVK